LRSKRTASAPNSRIYDLSRPPAEGEFEPPDDLRRTALLRSDEEIAIYSPERSVVDAMRLRSQVGTDVAYEALRRYLRRPGASTGNLLRLARRLRSGGTVQDALQVLTG
jgi:hypothetical protein